MGPMMSEIADLLLAAGAIGAGFYCYILARRLRRFNDLERGVGGAVALLSAQVDDLTRALAAANEGARASRNSLTEQIGQAEAVARRLEILVASVHDITPDRPRQTAQPHGHASAGRTDQPSAHFMRRPIAPETRE